MNLQETPCGYIMTHATVPHMAHFQLSTVPGLRRYLGKVDRLMVISSMPASVLNPGQSNP